MLKLISRGKLTTLVFHKVPVTRHPLSPAELDLDDFTAVLHATLRRFRILPLEDALIALRAGNLPDNAACITFDDGYPDWRMAVVPVLERLGVHATFFVTSGQYVAGLPMWNERILHAVAAAPPGTDTLLLKDAGLDGMGFDTVAQRQHTIRQLDAFLKYQDPETKERLLVELENHTGTTRVNAPSMEVADLRDLHARGFGIGGHSVTHPILSRCTERQAYEEIAGAREQLESLIRGKVVAFAYPNGAPGKDFGPEHIEMVRRAGYRYAFTTLRGVASAGTSPLQIPRFTPWGPSQGRMFLQFARNLMRRAPMLEEEASQHKQALMVAFHFPPQAGSSGILRTLNFVKYLPQQGWDTSVVAVTPRAFEDVRNDLVSSIPSQTRIVRAGALDAARHMSIKGKYPRVFALPDRWSSWWLPAVWAGMREIRRKRPDIIWSTYPISTAHLIGGSLSRLSGIPWVADFRDPMVNRDYPADKTQRRLWQWLEANVLRHASACVFTTASAAQEYQRRYPDHAAKCHVIENGYDEEAFEQVVPLREGVADGTLLLLHSGLIYPKDRDPSTFFAAVCELIDEGHLDARRLCIRFRAPHHGEEVMACAERYGLTNCVEVGPPIPYHRAIAEMTGSDLLLVFQGSNFNTQIPAKIYEYLRSERPILAVVDPEGGTAGQLRRFHGVHIADIHSKESIRESLLASLHANASREQENALALNRHLVQAYSRSSQTGSLGRLFDRVSRVAP
ncbi:polysaccharide deacetylase family protein [Hydrogenophaga sp.]|uniref:polysaccharide deacetylase family protein n=1 Tax=Hydrogenophaga sp. TaxID=1904254 RepID=UPI0025BED8A5|nr:polysaccharide deacetylase family protein [Hydrogenophaga sp.]MBT9465183.1 polysaccharide deacetylase family protein [Hydrogenophaga sp.]